MKHNLGKYENIKYNKIDPHPKIETGNQITAKHSKLKMKDSERLAVEK